MTIFSIRSSIRHLVRPPAQPLVIASFAIALAYGGSYWLHLLHQWEGGHEHHTLSPFLHWLRDASLALPLMLLASWLALHLANRLLVRGQPEPSSVIRHSLTAASVAVLGSLFLGLGSPLHGLLFEAHHGGHTLSLPAHILRDSLLALSATYPLCWLLSWSLLLRSSRPVPPIRASISRWHGWRLAPMQLAALLAIGILFSAPAQPSSVLAASFSCAEGAVNRTYDVVAINVNIPYNRWGDVDANGQMYVLRGDKAAVENWSLPLNADPALDPAGNRRLRPRPLVLRANEGECVKVTLTNQLNEKQAGGTLVNPRASIHVHGPAFDVQKSDGSAVGWNEDTTIARGESITYYWRAPEEGLYFFHDHGAQAGSEADGGSNAHGLFGALAVEPAGSVWLDPVSGKQLYTQTDNQSGELYIDAVIRPPGKPAFRESVQLSQDEIPGIGFGFNYGAEPIDHRVANLCPDCVGEETMLSSWAYGDPALVKLASGPGPWLPTPGNTKAEGCRLSGSCWVSNVTHAYPNDPMKIRFAHAGVKETHVFHLHAHQWRAESKDPNSVTIDSQTYGTGETFTAELIGGAGSKPGTVGDSIFHCHLYPHFADGFWALLRVHDVRESGTGTTPDGIRVRNLRPLPDRTAPPLPTANNPGFPRFIPGEFGWRPPQPPGGITEGGPDGTAATRIVAGKPLDPAKVEIERNVQLTLNNGKTPKPGAPFRDPCPAGAREITYNVSVIQTDIVYNEAGWHDTQGRILVLDRDVEAVLAGTKQPEPLFIRVNAGDCVNFNLTNRLPNWFGNDAFLELQQTNLVGEHIHLLKFDVLGSDGATNGWNYTQAAFSKQQVAFNQQVLAGTATCDRTGGCRLPLPADWDPQWTGQELGQTIHERWYADDELRTVFTHDHHFPAVDQNRGLFGALVVEPKGMDMRHPKSGTFFQPINDPANGPVCGTACEGIAAGTMMDLIGPGTNDDFREFGLAFQDFVSLTRKGGDPRNPADTFNPPDQPEKRPNDDPGVMGINYRNAPFVLRNTVNGNPVDPAYTFSSWVFGDPKTPVLEAYAGDQVRLRLIAGAQEEQHVFALHGMRWRDDPTDPNSPLVNSKAIGLSEAFNFEIPKMECGDNDTCQGDYLYSSTPTDDLYLGMWGLMRVFGKRHERLLPLPDNVPQKTMVLPAPPVTGEPPPKSPKPGNPCPSGATVRNFHVVALETPITYNAKGDHDPYGLMYTVVQPGETIEQAMERARANPEPLVLRANEGDCLDVTLTNRLTAAFLNHKGAADGDPKLPLEPPTGTAAGLRVSLHPQLLPYDVLRSDGATIGFNFDQTAGPGESILYRWYADDVTPGELGATNLLDYGDVRGHRHHGLFAGLTILPKGSTYYDPLTGNEIVSGVSADIRHPDQPDFRDFTLFFQDGMNLRHAGGNEPIPDPSDHPPTADEPADTVDAEDRGEKGFNYRSEPFRNRLGREPIAATQENPLDGQALAHVFSSATHGDPRTSIFRAYAGDAVRLRVLQGSDKPRQHAFQLSGHAWKAQPHDANSTLIATTGGMSVMRTVNAHLPSAGGEAAVPGDYRYSCGVYFHHLSGGLWGIMRLYAPPAATTDFTPTTLDASNDNPHRDGYHPIFPLEYVPVIDTTPPPAPTATPVGGIYTSDQSVELASEAGATIRYTLDDSTPTATTGTVYTGPILITQSTTLKAIAIDKAGNISTVTTEGYTLQKSTGDPITAAPAPAQRISITNGTVVSGDVAQLAIDDGAYLVLNSVQSGTKQVVNWTGAYTVPVEQRNIAGLQVDYDGGGSTDGINRVLALYNFATSSWETIKTETQTSADLRTTITVSGDPKRFLSSGGEIRMRVRGQHSSSFQLKADLMTFTVTYQP